MSVCTEAEATGVVNLWVALAECVVAVSVSNVLLVLGNGVLAVVVVIELLLAVGDEVLPVTIVRKVSVGIREGTVTVIEVLPGVGDLAVWTPDGVRVVLSVVPFVEEVTESLVVSVVEEEEEGMAINEDVPPIVVETGEEVMAEAVVTG